MPSAPEQVRRTAASPFDSPTRVAGEIQNEIRDPHGKVALKVSSTGPDRTRADEPLITRIRTGDQEAMATIYDRYSGVVYSVALRVLGNPDAAEDVLQEVMLQLWRDPDAFDSARGKLAPWLAIIARHRSVNYLRKRRPTVELSECTIASDVDLEVETECSRAIERARRVLADMPETQRIVLELAVFDGLTDAEIAVRTGQSLGTIKTRVCAALAAIRKAVTR